MSNTDLIIEQTKKWVMDVVIGCNFCPFALREVKQNRVRYAVESGSSIQSCLSALQDECKRLDQDENIETTLIILPNAVSAFKEYLQLTMLADKQIRRNGYEGTYQVATFHPEYRFAGTPADDPANFTNRSIYPMLHLLRERSIEAALKSFPEPERIPEKNIRFTRDKGALYMKTLRDACMNIKQ